MLYIRSRVNQEEIRPNKLQSFLLSKLDRVPMPPLFPPMPTTEIVDSKIHPSRWFPEQEKGVAVYAGPAQTWSQATDPCRER